MRPAPGHLRTLLFGVGLSFAGATRAQAPVAPSRDAAPLGPGLRVVHEAGAEGCPDDVELSERVEQLRGRRDVGGSSTYQVTFGLRDREYRAAIEMDGGGVRVLTDQGSTCASLGEAAAITLALLRDSERPEPPADEEPPPPPSLPAAAAVASPPSSTTRAGPLAYSRRVRISFAAGGASLFGVASTAAPAALVDVGLFVNRFHTSVGSLWMPPQAVSLSPGQVREELVSGFARACYAPLGRERLRLELCTGLYAGLLSARARGYTRNDAVKRAWLAVPLEAALSASTPNVGVGVGATALLPVRQSDLAIDNLGTVYQSWPVGLLLTIRVFGSAAL